VGQVSGACQPTISIRTGLIAAVTGLSLLATGTLAWNAAQDWRALSRAEAAQQADAAANRFSAGLFEVLMERLATNNALQAPAPAGPEELREIERRRTAVRENFQPGLASLSERDFPGREALLRDLRAALERADAFRRQADEALRLPRERRDEALRRDYVPTITASVKCCARGVVFRLACGRGCRPGVDASCRGKGDRLAPARHGGF
jgi:hypothetical protein